jgi:hypothetical protein
MIDPNAIVDIEEFGRKLTDGESRVTEFALRTLGGKELKNLFEMLMSVKEQQDDEGRRMLEWAQENLSEDELKDIIRVGLRGIDQRMNLK